MEVISGSLVGISVRRQSSDHSEIDRISAFILRKGDIMKKKTVLILCIVCILAAATAVCGIRAWREFTGYSSVLKANWDLELPYKADCREAFIKNDEPSFHGDGIRYHVFSYEKEETLETWLPWQEDVGPMNYYDTGLEATEAWLDEISVPSDQRPLYEGSVFWYGTKEDHSEILIIWNRESQRLYIVESFL